MHFQKTLHIVGMLTFFFYKLHFFLFFSLFNRQSQTMHRYPQLSTRKKFDVLYYISNLQQI